MVLVLVLSKIEYFYLVYFMNFFYQASFKLLDSYTISLKPVNFSLVVEGSVGKLAIDEAPGRGSNSPCKGVIGYNNSTMVDEIKSKGDIIGNLAIGGSGISVLSVIPADQVINRKLSGPGGHPGAESKEESISEESVGLFNLIGNRVLAEEVSEFTQDVVWDGNEADGEYEVHGNPSSFEEANKTSNYTIATVANIVGGSELLSFTAPELGSYSTINSSKTSISSREGSDNNTGESTPESPKDGERGGEVVSLGSSSLVSEVEFEHTKNGYDQRTEVIVFINTI